MLKMFNPFKRQTTASDAGKLGAQVKAEREREKYVKTNGDLAKLVGTTIKWADR
jgi:hypothetical protein